ncbi:hypothetical protein BS78_10G108600 [Paspalum vaginatum]|nr:hypothetical protein BS78_10G108600 [Paspalum vaginatum]
MLVHFQILHSLMLMFTGMGGLLGNQGFKTKIMDGAKQSRFEARHFPILQYYPTHIVDCHFFHVMSPNVFGTAKHVTRSYSTCNLMNNCTGGSSSEEDNALLKRMTIFDPNSSMHAFSQQ